MATNTIKLEGGQVYLYSPPLHEENAALVGVQVSSTLEPRLIPAPGGKFRLRRLLTNEEFLCWKARQQKSRHEAAVRDMARYRWKHTPLGWLCFSNSGGCYEVTKDGCTCEDYQGRCRHIDIRCKHMESLRLRGEEI